MTGQEFVEALARALRSELTEQEVAENVSYYENYISQEVSSGKSEEEVTAQLGDPRLIARTILDVDQQREEQEERGYTPFDSWSRSGQTVYTEDAGGGYTEDVAGGYTEDVADDEPPFGENTHMHTFRLGGWKATLILTAVVLVIFFILGTMFAIVWRLLPFILLGALLVWIWRRFFS